ncbi:MAG: TadE/TadG family type IV pilus assembly protein, partial [Thermoleophilaceae bacterium]
MRTRAICRRCGGTSETGQASVELLGAIPAVLLVGALVWQLALAGHALWLCANAARAGARAEAVGRSGKWAAR